MDFVVNPKNLKETSTVTAPSLSLSDGDVLFHIVQFAFTANNISYAATGDALRYFKFFPGLQGKGRVPVWGTAIVVASRCLGVRQGQRVYGYFPMSHYVVMHPVQVTNSDFIDGIPHRRSLPAVYNQYFFCDEDPFYTPRTEHAMMILRPLFFTSWLLVDFFQQQNFCNANTMIISSASSKTSIGLAFLLQQYNQHKNQQHDSTRLQVVGLTSARNRAFVERLQVYDQIVVYDRIEQELESTTPACFVDMAGNTNVTTRLHEHLQDNIKYSCLVGAAHVGQGGKPMSKLPGARPKFFFAPSWTAKRILELGNDGNNNDNGDSSKASSSKRRGLEILLHNVLIDYHRFVRWCLEDEDGPSNGGWLHVQQHFGPEQVTKGYISCLNGEIGPDTAVIMSLWDTTTLQPPAQTSKL